MSISRTKRFRIFTRDKFTCQYCGRHAPEVELQVDHREPCSRGGSDDPSNLVTACTDCNLGKSDVRVTIPAPLVCYGCTQEGRKWVPYHAESERDLTDGSGGFVAYYICEFGHRWFWVFSGNERADARQADEFVEQMRARALA